MPSSSISILIMERYKLVRAAIKAMLAQWADFRVTGEAPDCEAGLELAHQSKPDIILAHMGLSDDGQTLALLNALRDTDIAAKVILIADPGDTKRVIRAVGLGAMGVVSKDESADVLAKAIHKVQAGEVWLERTLTARALKEITDTVEGRRIRTTGANPGLLSEREGQVIALVCRGLRNDDIGRWLGIAEPTVRHHLTSVFGKLNLQNRMELVIYSFNNGLHVPRKPLPAAPPDLKSRDAALPVARH